MNWTPRKIGYLILCKQMYWLYTNSYCGRNNCPSYGPKNTIVRMNGRNNNFQRLMHSFKLYYQYNNIMNRRRNGVARNFFVILSILFLNAH